MKTLCMDSSHKYLVLGLYEDNQLIADMQRNLGRINLK